MYALVMFAALPGPFVEHPLFTQAQQRAAFEATVRTSHPASRSVGTAVIVARKGEISYLLTAAHLVPKEALPERIEEDPARVELFLYAAQNPEKISSRGEARVVARMPNEDIAVLEAKLPNPPAPIPICPKDKLIMRLPMTVMTVGIIPDGPPEIVFDQVKEKKWVRKPDGTDANYWEADIAQQTGRSGGPMIDARGYVIGIASGIQHEKGYYSATSEIHFALRGEKLSWLYEHPMTKK